MALGLRVILFNTEEQYGATLRRALLQFDGVKIVAEVAEPALLPQVVTKLPAHLLVVNVDPTPDAILPIAGEIASAYPDLAIFGVSQSTDAPLILAAMRRGLSEFLNKPIDPDILSEALERLAQRLGDPSRNGRLIAVVGGAGGVGATALAVNLAVEMVSLTSGGVCIVDLDYRFGQVATSLDVEPTYGVGDLCDSPERVEPQVIEKAVVQHASGVQVLGNPPAVAPMESITGANCVGVLSTLVSLYDYVIVDGPSRYDPGAKTVLDISDEILLVIELLVPNVRNVQRMLQAMREGGFNLGRVRLICNRVGRESSYLTVQDVASTLGTEVFATIPDDWAAVSSAINLGEPLAASQPRGRTRQAIREIAERLHTQRHATDDTGSPKKAGLPAGTQGLLSKVIGDA